MPVSEPRAICDAVVPRIRQAKLILVDADERRWYYAWLPGPWLVARRSTGRDALNRRQHVLDLACEYCGHQVVLHAEDRERHVRAVSAGRAHWEAHAAGDLELTFFSLPGVGDLNPS